MYLNNDGENAGILGAAIFQPPIEQLAHQVFFQLVFQQLWKRLQDIARKWYFISKLSLDKICQQPVNEIYSSCFVISGYREVIIFEKMAISMK